MNDKLLRIYQRYQDLRHSKRRNQAQGVSYALASLKTRRKELALLYRTAKLLKRSHTPDTRKTRAHKSRGLAIVTTTVKAMVQSKEVMMGEGDDEGRTMATMMSVDQSTVRGEPMEVDISGLYIPPFGAGSSCDDVDMHEHSLPRLPGDTLNTRATTRGRVNHQGDVRMKSPSMLLHNGCGVNDASSSRMYVDL